MAGAFFVVACSAAFELWARFFGDVGLSGVSYHPVEGWRFKSNYHKPRHYASFTGKEILFSTNREGFRGREPKTKKKPGTKRIMFLGDSYTAGVFVDDKKIFTRLFENELNKAAEDTGYEVMNRAIPAWGADQQLLYFKNAGVKYDPDHVFLMLSHSDIRETIAKEFFEIDANGALRDRKNRSIPLMERFRWFLANHSFAFRWLQKYSQNPAGEFSGAIFELFPVNTYWHDLDLFKKEYPLMIRKKLPLFEAVVSEIQKICNENGIKLVMVALPVKLEFTEIMAREDLRAGRVARYFEKIARKHDIEFLDLYEELGKEERPLRMFISSEYHYTELGHRFIADKLAAYFVRNQLGLN